MKYSLIIIALATLGCKTQSNLINSLDFEKKIFKTSKGDTLLYNSFTPAKTKKKMPLFVFLHGAGERGKDNEAQLVHIAPILINEKNRIDYPAKLIFPQCPSEDYWAHVDVEDGVWTVANSENPTNSMAKVIELISELRKDPSIDLDRIYIGGLSMGGFGTLDVLSRKPEWFAAAIAICGGGNLELAANYKEVPVKLFHGAKDPTVPVDLSRSLYQHLKDMNASVEYIEYPEGDHLVWNPAFEDPSTLSWLFAQRKGRE